MINYSSLIKKISLCSAVFLLGITSCFIDSEKTMRFKLSVICKNDLKATVGDLKKGSISDSIYFKIRSFQTFPKGEFSAKAEVDYFFLKNVNVKMVRKYRFNRIVGLWDRYYNEWEFVHDSIKGN